MRTALADHLPACLVEGVGDQTTESFMRRFLRIFDELAASVEMQVGGIEHVIDPAVAPPGMLLALRVWTGMDVGDPGMSEADLRVCAQRVSTLLWRRGTKTGLTGILEMATGRAVEVVDGGGVFPPGPKPSRPGHVTIRLDGAVPMTDQELLALLRSELPAEVTFDLHVGRRTVWPRPEQA